MKVLVISSVVPDWKSFGGSLVLARYLLDNKNIETKVIHWKKFPFIVKLIGKLNQLKFNYIAKNLDGFFQPTPSLDIIINEVNQFQPDIILTVAHGHWHLAAVRVAQKLKIPLVTFFQDWWPDFPEVPNSFKKKVELQIKDTCRKSSLCIAVSEGMVQKLGSPRNTILIHDVPGKTAPKKECIRESSNFSAVYFGNLSEYGPKVEEALLEFETSTDARLDVYGNNPKWSNGVEDAFRSRGRYLGSVTSDKLTSIICNYDAILVIMSFDKKIKSRMTTSFPSKLIEGAQYGLPIIIWGPEYCSAVQWARLGNRALCVTDPDPKALRREIEKLSSNQEERQRLSNAARDAAETDFSPERIQAQFMDALKRTLCMTF